MGGTSSQTQQQQTVSQPWAPAQPTLQGILGQVNTGLQNTGITPAETQALNTGAQNATNWSGQNAPIIGANATSLLNGGGAQNQDPAIQAAYQRYFDQTNPLASNLNYDPNQNPGTAALLDQIRGDVASNVNGAFAAGGRDFSGANQMAYGRGIAQGEAPVLFDQYNANRSAQQGAAGNLYNAGNTTAGLLNSTNQQGLANKLQGVQSSQDALSTQNTGVNAALAAEAARRGIPVQALGLLAQIGIPIAGLGGQTNSTGSGTSTMSGAQQFGTIASGAGNLFHSFMPSGI